MGTFMLDKDLAQWLNFLEIFSEVYPDTYNTPEKALEGYNETIEHYNNIINTIKKEKGS